MSMKLREIFDHLSAGEFGQLSIGGAPAGVIDESNQAKVIGLIQLGLTALHKRFKLREGETTLILVPDQAVYPLGVEDALQIETVKTSLGTELAINEGGNAYSVSTPTLVSLRVPLAIVNQDASLPDSLSTDSLQVGYRADHPAILVGQGVVAPDSTVIALPRSHLEALLHFVASRVTSNVGMAGELTTSSTWHARFLAECRMLDDAGLQIDDQAANDRLRRGGWV